MKKRMVILGAAESGVGAAALAKVKGFDVFVSDMGHIKENYKDVLRQYEVEWEEGKHTEDLLLHADEVVKSPGIPDQAPMVVKLREKGIPVISEIEFAGRYTEAKMVCITGSNGKTTTTSLIYHILQQAGYNVGLAGNIGRSLALQLAEGRAYDYYVIELSSFQLDNMYAFRAHVAVLLNITPDHLDRYDNCMQHYTDSKMRILQNQTEEDAFIYWADDPIIQQELPKYAIKARQCPFSIVRSEGMAGYVQQGEYVLEVPSAFTLPQSQLSLSGKHNLYNSLAAGIAARLVGVSTAQLTCSLGDFKGVEHRLEKVTTRDGVLYINDSKATNIDSAWYALECQTHPVVWIVGGTDKGNDYSILNELVQKKVKAIVCMGVDNTKIHAAFEKFGLPMVDTMSADEAVMESAKLAEPGDVVLLSPCCASFDLFDNYEDRGRKFKNAVRHL